MKTRLLNQAPQSLRLSAANKTSYQENCHEKLMAISVTTAQEGPQQTNLFLNQNVVSTPVLVSPLRLVGEVTNVPVQLG